MTWLNWQDGLAAKGPKPRTCIPAPRQRENWHSQVIPDSDTLAMTCAHTHECARTYTHTLMNTQIWSIGPSCPQVISTAGSQMSQWRPVCTVGWRGCHVTWASELAEREKGKMLAEMQAHVIFWNIGMGDRVKRGGEVAEGKAEKTGDHVLMRWFTVLGRGNTITWHLL